MTDSTNPTPQGREAVLAPSELLPCPFCGGAAFCHDFRGGAGYWQVECQDCDATTKGHRIKADAIEVWNRRAAAGAAEPAEATSRTIVNHGTAENPRWSAEAPKVVAWLKYPPKKPELARADRHPGLTSEEIGRGWVSEPLVKPATPIPAAEAPKAVADDLRKLRFIYRVLGNFVHAPQSDRADAYAMVRELIESTWKAGASASESKAAAAPVAGAERERSLVHQHDADKRYGGRIDIEAESRPQPRWYTGEQES